MQPKLSSGGTAEAQRCKITKKLARVMKSDVATMMEQAGGSGSEVAESVECACCGMSEECTPVYIRRIREYFEGKWICGLCAEAVKELEMGRGTASKEQALEAHMALCKKFNRTVRLNPKLSLAVSMRDIARKSSERRTTTTTAMMNASKIVRAMSCGPRLDVDFKQSKIQ